MRSGIFIILLSCTQLGRLPDRDSLVEMQTSRNYDPVAEIFINQDRGIVDRLRRQAAWPVGSFHALAFQARPCYAEIHTTRR